MPANECIPYKKPGAEISAKATAGITGKRFVKISAGRTGGPALSSDLLNVYSVAHAGAGQKAIGVSGHDIASGAVGPIHTGPGTILPVTSGAAITAGAEVESDANGKAIPLASGKSLGVCLNTVGGADVDAEIKLA